MPKIRAGPLMTGARAEIVACSTCGGVSGEVGGRSRGEQLLERLDRELASRADGRLSVSAVRCLWACKKSCAVLLRSLGRPSYVLVELEPSDISAKALIDYAGSYLDSPDGAVPYKTWPAALKGHFHCRIPGASELARAPAEPPDLLQDPSP